MTKKERENCASHKQKKRKKNIQTLSGHGYFSQYLLRKIKYKWQYYTIVINHCIYS